MNVHCACSEWDFSLIGNKEGERPMAGCHTLWSINWLIDHSEAKQTCEGRGVRAEQGKEGGQSMPPTLVEMVQVRVCLTHSQACVHAASFFFFILFFILPGVYVCMFGRAYVLRCAFPHLSGDNAFNIPLGNRSHYTEAETQAWRPRLCM